MKRMQIAAEAGDALAQFNLGVMYDNGTDDNNHPRVSDHHKAKRWFLSAAKQGLPRAQLKLAQTYMADFASEAETPDHRVEACAWFIRAVAGETGAQQLEAQSGYDKVAATMTEAEIKSARRMAERWAADETYVADLPRRKHRG